MRTFHCLNPQRQAELASQFSWLAAVQKDAHLPLEAKTLNLSVFDHWLTEPEAEALISRCSREDQLRRDRSFATFYSLLIAETEVLSIAWRGLGKDRPRFRSFTSPSAALRYLRHNGSGLFRPPHIRLALPDFSAIYYQGWDSTSHLYIANLVETETISEWATQAGLHVLP